MKKCLKCGDAASDVRLSVCETCHQIHLHGDFMELFKENLARCLFENIAEMTYILEGSDTLIKRLEQENKKEEPLYQQLSKSFMGLYRAIDLLHREIVKIFHPEADLDLLIEINTAAVKEMCKLGEMLTATGNGKAIASCDCTDATAR